MLKSLITCGAATLLASMCASRVATMARLSPIPHFAVGATATVAAGVATTGMAFRYAHYHADARVADALARANLDEPLAVYLSSIRRDKFVRSIEWQVIPTPTGTERFKRVRNHLKQKWGIELSPWSMARMPSARRPPFFAFFFSPSWPHACLFFLRKGDTLGFRLEYKETSIDMTMKTLLFCCREHYLRCRYPCFIKKKGRKGCCDSVGKKRVSGTPRVLFYSYVCLFLK
nr:hypothetical protein [Pandoravirus aubagnensis]